MIKGTTAFDIYNTISNPNLFINGNFQVWQRGTVFSKVTAQEFSADRWMFRGSGEAVINNNSGITLAITGTGQLMQSIEWKNRPGGKYTISMEARFLNVTSFTFRIVVGEETSDIIDSPVITVQSGFNMYSYTFDVPDGLDQLDVYLFANLVSTDVPNISVRWAKFEYGEYVTKCIPRLYPEEFAMCQRYFQRYIRDDDSQYGGQKQLNFTIINISASTIVGTVLLPTFMYRAPDVDGLNALQLRAINGNSGLSATPSLANSMTTSIFVNMSGSGFTATTQYRIGTLNNGVALDLNGEMSPIQ